MGNDWRTSRWFKRIIICFDGSHGVVTAGYASSSIYKSGRASAAPSGNCSFGIKCSSALTSHKHWSSEDTVRVMVALHGTLWKLAMTA